MNSLISFVTDPIGTAQCRGQWTLLVRSLVPYLTAAPWHCMMQWPFVNKLKLGAFLDLFLASMALHDTEAVLKQGRLPYCRNT